MHTCCSCLCVTNGVFVGNFSVVCFVRALLQAKFPRTWKKHVYLARKLFTYSNDIFEDEEEEEEEIQKFSTL